MGRPPMAVGTAGSVRSYRTSSGWRSRTRFRDYDGVVREVERTGHSKGGAEQALSVALRDRVRIGGDAEITPDTKVAVLAETWWVDISRQDKSPTTLQSYRLRLDRQILPGMGNLRVRELTVGTVDRFLRVVESKNGSAVAKMCRSVLSGLCGRAARHDALASNPVRDTGSISTKPKKAPRSLTLPEALQLRAMLTYDEKAIARDLVDLIGFMLATGLRIGEAAGLLWRDVDLDAATVNVEATVVRITGVGLVRKAVKTSAGARGLEIPQWAVNLLKDRDPDSHASSDPIFPAPMGGFRDPSNSQADLREALDTAGFDWVTSHNFRKTAASLMDDAGLSARAVADQLGHTNPSLSQDKYLGRRRATGAKAVLEALAI